jgi:hypothetical protein
MDSCFKLASNGIKLSFFRLYPERETEEHFSKKLSSSLGAENLAVFKAFGFYDIIALYPLDLEKTLERSGTIYGIRSFASIDCLCWDSQEPEQLIKQIHEFNLVSIIAATLTRPQRYDFGGLRNTALCESLDPDSIYLNSSSWAEQVLILGSVDMTGLIKKAKETISCLKRTCSEIQSTIGVNLTRLSQIESDDSVWDEQISEEAHVRWTVRIDSPSTLHLFNTKLLSLKIPDIFKKGPALVNLEGTEQHFAISNCTWGQLINAIRTIRNQCADFLLTTKLIVLQQIIIPCNEHADSLIPRHEPFIEEASLKDDDCQTILNNMGDRIGTYVARALYTVSNYHASGPSAQAALGSLVYAAAELKSLAISDPAEQFLDFDIFQLICSVESERLIAAVRQRLDGLPAYRESNYPSFDTPPTTVKLYYEASEYVIKKLISKYLNINYTPYVLLDTVDYPEHSHLSIRLPIHLKDSLLVYNALSHEALHALESCHRKDYETSPEVLSYITRGCTQSFSSTLRSRSDLLSEVFVELLDFGLTYRDSLAVYLDQLWTFFVKHFSGGVKRSVRQRDIVRHILRTFIVRIYSITWDRNNNQDAYHSTSFLSLMANPHDLRELLRSHISDCKSVCAKAMKKYLKSNSEIISWLDDNDSNSIFELRLDSLIQKMQSDVREMQKALSTIYYEASEVINSYPLHDMHDWANSPSTKSIVDHIVSGTPVNKVLKYPHLVVNLCIQSFLHNIFEFDTRDERRITLALLISLWNSLNLENQASTLDQKP